MKLHAALIAIACAAATVASAQTPPQPGVQLRRAGFGLDTWPVDLNNDGITDLVGGGRITVAIGRGDGTFGAPLATTVVATPIAVGDFNNDGRRDVVVTGDAILPGNGNGTFGAPRPVTGPPTLPDLGEELRSRQALVADFDGDGRRDLGLISGNSLRIHPGNGDFTFRPAVPLVEDAMGYPRQAIAADFNGDGRPDVAVVYVDFTIDVYINGGGLLFSRSTITGPQAELQDITAGDLNGDSRVDLVVAGSSDGPNERSAGRIFTLLGNGNGTFAAPVEHAAGIQGSIVVVVGDFNRDGRRDIATGNRSRIAIDSTCGPAYHYWDSVSILRGRGDGSFAAARRFHLDYSTNDSGEFQNTLNALKTSDLNGDGHTDLIVSPGTLLLNSTPGINRPPTIELGPDREIGGDNYARLHASLSDPDYDVLSVAWRDEAGTFSGSLPFVCDQVAGRITATVTDGLGATATDSVVISPRPAWSSADVGQVAAPGSSEFDGFRLTVQGSGADIWNTADEFRFASVARSGDFDFVARVASVENVNRWTKAGLMVRSHAGAGSAHASVFATPTTVRGISVQGRSQDGGSSVEHARVAIAPPVWLKLMRRGRAVYLAYRKEQSDSWILLSIVQVDLPDSVLVGFAVSSHVDGRLAAATFDSISLLAAPTWRNQDIGVVGVAGRKDPSPDITKTTLEGSGADIWNTVDAFHYEYTPFFADGGISTRVTGIENTHRWAKAGVMFRESTDAASKQVMLIVSPGMGVALQYRSTTNGPSAQIARRAGTAPVWLSLSRLGSFFYAYTSSDGVTWDFLGDVHVPMKTEILVGLPVTSHNNSTLATGRFEDVTVELRR